jgi:hypothetical protein
VYVHLAEGFKVSIKEAKWSNVDGKKMSSEAVATRLKPDVTVLLSSDGAEVDQKYLRMFKAETLVLIVPVEGQCRTSPMSAVAFLSSRCVSAENRVAPYEKRGEPLGLLNLSRA